MVSAIWPVKCVPWPSSCRIGSKNTGSYKNISRISLLLEGISTLKKYFLRKKIFWQISNKERKIERKIRKIRHINLRANFKYLLSKNLSYFVYLISYSQLKITEKYFKEILRSLNKEKNSHSLVISNSSHIKQNGRSTFERKIPILHRPLLVIQK